MANGPSMTWLFIGLAAFILMFTLGTQLYVDIMDKNGGTIDTAYSNKYAQIAGYQSNLTEFQSGLTSDQSIWTRIPSFIGSGFNVLGIGLSGVITFFSLAGLIPQLFSTIFDGLGLPPVFMWFCLVVIGVYIFTRVYKAIRGQPDET